MTERQRQGHGDRDRYRKRMTVKWTGTHTWSDGHGQEVRDCDRQTGNGNTDRVTYVLPSLVDLLSQILEEEIFVKNMQIPL